MSYSKIGWEDTPSTATPVNAANLNKMDNQIATNTTDIATNKSNIATNATNIATNKSNIATNTTDIATNKSNIATNKSNIATNKSNIATNKSNISLLSTKMGSADISSIGDGTATGAIKEISDDKLDVASIDITGVTTTILALVQGIGAKKIHCARWICKTTAGGANISDKPSNTAFACEAICCRSSSVTDYRYVVYCWIVGTQLPYIANVEEDTTSISWTRNPEGYQTIENSPYYSKWTSLVASGTRTIVFNWSAADTYFKVEVYGHSNTDYLYIAHGRASRSGLAPVINGAAITVAYDSSTNILALTINGNVTFPVLITANQPFTITES